MAMRIIIRTWEARLCDVLGDGLHGKDKADGVRRVCLDNEATCLNNLPANITYDLKTELVQGRRGETGPGDKRTTPFSQHSTRPPNLKPIQSLVHLRL
jgi:hypothetical protein